VLSLGEFWKTHSPPFSVSSDDLRPFLDWQLSEDIFISVMTRT
jgi:hypothetical protein